MANSNRISKNTDPFNDIIECLDGVNNTFFLHSGLSHKKHYDIPSAKKLQRKKI